jgi:hypothetical protein
MRRRSCGNSRTWNGKKQRGQTAPPLQNANKTKAIKKRGQEPTRQALYRMSGVDITHIDAIGVETVEVVLSEYGPDLSRFPTEKQFVSHVTLAPHVPTLQAFNHSTDGTNDELCFAVPIIPGDIQMIKDHVNPLRILMRKHSLEGFYSSCDCGFVY